MCKVQVFQILGLALIVFINLSTEKNGSFFFMCVIGAKIIHIDDLFKVIPYALCMPVIQLGADFIKSRWC